MKTRAKSRLQPEADWRKEWEPIFQAARQGRFPNRLGAVLEMMMCQCALRKYRVQRRSAAKS